MSNQVPTPRQVLESRGVYEEAIKLGWVETAHYWHYPVYSLSGEIITKRGKAYPRQDLPKYIWPDGKPNNPEADFYIPKGTKEAIKEAGGVCYLANGEIALVAYRAAGIYNVIATLHSEVTVPKSIADEIKLLGISKLINIADKDNAGLKAAAKWRDSLRGLEVEYQAKQWPDFLPEKSDANDLWIALDFNTEAFKEAISRCQALILPNPEIKVSVNLNFDTEMSEAKAKLIQALHSELETRGLFNGKIWQGQWASCVCPYHDDTKKNESAGFNTQSGVLNCFVCGSISPYESAKRLNIDWKSFYPKQEGKKKPLKRDLARFEAALESIQLKQDNRTYADVITDEIAARIQAYEAGQYLGFGSWKDLPISIITAVLTLCNGRSNTAVFLGRLHEALRLGKLPSICNYEMLCKALDLPYRIVFKACFELNALSFLPKLSGINNIESIVGMKSGKNSEGRPCDWFLVELEKEEIKSLLLKQLEIYFLEKYARKALALPTMAMVSAYGLNEESALDYRNRIKAIMNDSSNKAAKQAYDNEMFGDGTWKGWYKAIESDFVAPLDFALYADASDLRVAILQWWTSKIRPVNSRDELCRLLGCSDATIDKLLDKAKMINERQQTKLEFQVPATVKQMKFLWNKNQRDLQGKCWKGGFKLKGETAWQPIDESNYLESYATYAGRIEKGYMLIITPSKQRPMNEAEIKERDALLAQGAQEKALETVKEAKTEGSTVVRTQTAKIPVWTRHSYVFLYRQLQLLFHVFTDYSLGQKQAIVFDKQGSPITSGQLPALFTFFLSVASDTPKRKVKSFYGKDYDETIDIEALQVLADSQMAFYGEMEIEDAEDLPISQKSMDFLEKPKPVTPKVKQEAYDETWTWANHPEEFNERMRAIGG